MGPSSGCEIRPLMILAKQTRERFTARGRAFEQRLLLLFHASGGSPLDHRGLYDAGGENSRWHRIQSNLDGRRSFRCLRDFSKCREIPQTLSPKNRSPSRSSVIPRKPMRRRP